MKKRGLSNNENGHYTGRDLFIEYLENDLNILYYSMNEI